MTDDINNSGSSYPVLGPTGDGSNVTAAFTAADSRTNISTGEKLSVICGKIAKWFADLGAAAFRGVDATPTAGSTNLVESAGVKSALNTVENDIAIRVVGNKTTYASGAAIGQYVIVDGSTITGITDGLYKAAKAIPYNTVIDSTYLTAVSGGAANDLKSDIDDINNRYPRSITTYIGANPSTLSFELPMNRTADISYSDGASVYGLHCIRHGNGYLAEINTIHSGSSNEVTLSFALDPNNSDKVVITNSGVWGAMLSILVY